MAALLDLNDKVKLIIADRQMTPSQFADEIGVQRSSISHILSGRNRPSLEIIQKIVTRFPEFTYDWLLDQNQESLISPITSPILHRPSTPELSRTVGKKKPLSQVSSTAELPALVDKENQRIIERILVFFSDKTFTEYRPD